jgi:hypothetical protein
MSEARALGCWHCGAPVKVTHLDDRLDDTHTPHIRRADRPEARAVVEVCAYHKPGCTHYCENGHITADEAVQVDMERIYWKERATAPRPPEPDRDVPRWGFDGYLWHLLPVNDSRRTACGGLMPAVYRAWALPGNPRCPVCPEPDR